MSTKIVSRQRLNAIVEASHGQPLDAVRVEFQQLEDGTTVMSLLEDSSGSLLELKFSTRKLYDTLRKLGRDSTLYC